MLTWKNVINFSVKGNPQPDLRVEKTASEWRELLSPEQFRITRKKGTETPYSRGFCGIHEASKYHCACCNAPLFDATIKFESGTGWPSFTQPIEENAIQYEKDTLFGLVRVEVMCNTCDAHVGHVFPDGPESRGLGYCINSELVQLQVVKNEKGESFKSRELSEKKVIDYLKAYVTV